MPLLFNVQAAGLKVPLPPEKLTIPEGVLGPPVFATVAVQAEVPPALSAVGLQERVVVEFAEALVTTAFETLELV